MAYIVTVQLLIDAPNESEACDAVHGLEEHTQKYREGSSLVDWAFDGDPVKTSDELDDAICNETYEEGDFIK